MLCNMHLIASHDYCTSELCMNSAAVLRPLMLKVMSIVTHL